MMEERESLHGNQCIKSHDQDKVSLSMCTGQQNAHRHLCVETQQLPNLSRLSRGTEITCAFFFYSTVSYPIPSFVFAALRYHPIYS